MPDKKDSAKKSKYQLALKKYLNYLSSPMFLGVIVTIIFFFISKNYYKQLEKFDDIENQESYVNDIFLKSIDWRFKSRGTKPVSDQIVIVTVDDQSLEYVGWWPWPRSKMGQIIENLVLDGVKVIGFDAIFSEADKNSALPALKRVSNTLLQNGVENPKIDDFLKSELETADSDSKFAAIIKQYSKHIVLGTFFDDITQQKTNWSDICHNIIFENSPNGHYLLNEKSNMSTLENPQGVIQLPQELNVGILTHIQELEMLEVANWLSQNPEANKTIEKLTRDFGAQMPEGSNLTDLLYIVLTNKTDYLNEIFGSSLRAQKYVDKLTESIGLRNVTQMKKNITKSSFDYCERFLTSKDELINEKLYQDASYSIDFKTVSLKELWNSTNKESSDSKNTEKLDFDSWLQKLKNEYPKNIVNTITSWNLNIPIITEASQSTSYFNANIDPDGVIRHAMLLVRSGTHYFASLALRTFLQSHQDEVGLQIKLNEENLSLNTSGIKYIQEINLINKEGDPLLSIPTDRRGRLLINYSGPYESFPYVPAYQILHNDEMIDVRQNGVVHQVNAKEYLKDKTILIGFTAIGIYDLRVTPFSENTAGVETHANTLNNLITEYEKSQIKYQAAQKNQKPVIPTEISSRLGFLKSFPQEKNLIPLGVLIFGFIFSWLLTHLSSLYGLLITFMGIIGLWFFDKLFVFGQSYVVNILIPILHTISTFVAISFYKYFTEERKKRELKGTFEKYVSPSIVNEILKDPENINLGGKKMDLTVMFSDVRGFTTISEKLDPSALSDLLNSYLTPMTEIVFQTKGTLDKYMGDAIMAFWGAPIHFDDHANWACRCALKSLEKLKELQAQYRTKGLPEIDIGIGLNTGEMSVGNMGSETVRSYTIMGDSVNLGSRLEGINKQYGTRIIISEFTRKAISDQFITREMDWVRVKGKKLPVRIFELITEIKTGQDLNSDLQKILELWNLAFENYHKKDFQKALENFKKCLEVWPEDSASLLYIERCQEYTQEPPPEDWDGVFEMKSK